MLGTGWGAQGTERRGKGRTWGLPVEPLLYLRCFFLNPQSPFEPEQHMDTSHAAPLPQLRSEHITKPGRPRGESRRDPTGGQGSCRGFLAPRDISLPQRGGSHVARPRIRLRDALSSAVISPLPAGCCEAQSPSVLLHHVSELPRYHQPPTSGRHRGCTDGQWCPGHQMSTALGGGGDLEFPHLHAAPI